MNYKTIFILIIILFSCGHAKIVEQNNMPTNEIKDEKIEKEPEIPCWEKCDYIRIFCAYNNKATDHEMTFILDSLMCAKKPESSPNSPTEILSHEKYLEFQSELDNINNMTGAKPENDNIGIDIIENRKLIKSFHFDNITQIKKYLVLINKFFSYHIGVPVEMLIKYEEK